MDGMGPGALLFLGRDGEPTILTYYTVSYLLWPRPVGLCLSRADAVTPQALVRTQSAPVAVMYYAVDPPPAGPPPTMVGRHLALVAVSEREPWTTHCR
jgi:hypothetical protein